MRTRLWAVVAITAALGALTPGVSAAEEGLFTISGVVTDPVGRPLANAAVRDGHQTVITDEIGFFVLEERNPGAYFVSAERNDTEQQTKTVTANVPLDKTVDFELRYRLTTTLLPAAVTPGDSVVVEVESAAPDQPGQQHTPCVDVDDPFSPGTEPAQRSDEVGERWGQPLWVYEADIPQTASEGVYRFDARARTCTTGIELTDSASAWLTVDATAPAIGSLEPWYGSATTTLVVSATDPGAYPSGIAADTLTTTIDGTVVAGWFNPIEGEIRVPISDLDDGPYQLQVAVADNAGNELVALRPFAVDHTSPTWSDPSPTGVVDTPTPLLSVTVSDVGSGLNPASIILQLSDGIRTARLAHRYEPSTGTITYQIPDRIEGLQLGQSPLAPSTYTVEVAARDQAGNTSNTAWQFDVPIETTTPNSESIVPTALNHENYS